MPVNSLTLYRDFLEDNRPSMETYADNLARSLRVVAGDAFNVNEYRPAIPAWTFKCKMNCSIRIRYARYVSYPNQAKRNQGSINHILDQSYAHLLNVIDPSRSVITVHDLIPILAWKGAIPGLSYPHYPLLYKLTIVSLRKARALIAVSQNTKRDLVTHCGLKESDIFVVHNGVDSRFCPMSKEERAALRDSFRFPDQGTHVVLVTGSQSYKNHLTSLRVVARLQGVTKHPVQLVWLGRDNYDHEECLGKVELNNPVIHLSNLSAERLVSLYNSVDCLLFPSWYEGFGWPPLEAMACGTPVVTSNAASLPEVVADAALIAPPNDIDGLTEAVKVLLEDEDLRSEYIKRGYHNASRFTWNRCASKVADVYEQIIADTI
jgi:glycosyltransferase involved in cell wall biosynthesis